jgi:argininosuccinate lyase
MSSYDLKANLRNVANRAEAELSRRAAAASGGAPDGIPVWAGLIAAYTAHAQHLRRVDVIDDAGFAAIARALDAASGAAAGEGTPTALVRQVDERVDAMLPREFAGAATLGVSRVETLLTALRMGWREAALGFHGDVVALRGALLTLAEAHAVTIMAATWDRRPANPTTLAHFLGGALGPLGIATTRLEQAIALLDRSPFGAGIMAGDVLEADREAAADALGFGGPIVNTLDAVGSVEDLVAVADAVAAGLAASRRLMAEVLTWIRTEPTSFFLDERWEAFPEPSMPALSVSARLEHLVLDLQRAEGACRTFVEIARSVPFGPLGSVLDPLAAMMDDVLLQGHRAMTQSTAAIEEALIVNRAYLANRAGRAYTTAADLVPFLMTEESLPPAAARQIASLVVSRLRDASLEASAVTQDMIDSAAVMVIGRELKVEMETLGRYLAPRRFLERRQVLGAPSPDKTREWLAIERERLATDRAWADAQRTRWSEAVGRLDAARAGVLASDEG